MMGFLPCFKTDFLMGFRGIIDRLHDLRGKDGAVDIRRGLFAGADAVEEAADFRFVMVIHGEGILFGDKSAVFRGVQLEILAVLQTDAGLISHEIHKHFLFPDVLCPCAVQGDNRSGFLSGPAGADQRGDRIIHVVGAVQLGRARPHGGEGVAGDIPAQTAERLAGDRDGRGVAAAIHNQIKKMHAPVDQRATARNRLGGEIAAEAGDGTVERKDM